jgi:taurine-pyruvate aminotransferase
VLVEVGRDYTYFVNSGSEANEAGFKIARQYMKQEHPGEYRFKTIGRYFAYHGTTLATLDAGGMGERKAKFEPFQSTLCMSRRPIAIAAHSASSHPSCGLARVKNIEATILGEGPETVAEVIVEPVMSGIGVAVPPDEYLPEVEGLCRKYGILLHVDEVINGFGRTGKMFAHQHYGVSPDIIAIAKGISSAYLPIAATVVKDSDLEPALSHEHHAAPAADISYRERVADEKGRFFMVLSITTAPPRRAGGTRRSPRRASCGTAPSGALARPR